jgi:hypothetical protein
MIIESKSHWSLPTGVKSSYREICLEIRLDEWDEYVAILDQFSVTRAHSTYSGGFSPDGKSSYMRFFFEHDEDAVEFTLLFS